MSSSQNSPRTRSLATLTFAHNTSSLVLHLAAVNAQLNPFKALLCDLLTSGDRF